MSVPFIEFNKKEVTTDNCFIDEKLLKEIHDAGDENAYLTKVEETYGKVIFPVKADYPYTFASIALSMDGKMAYPKRPEGVLIAKSNTLNDAGALTDFYVLNFLRAYGDVVINGTKTLVSEPNMSMTVYDEDFLEDRRVKLGKQQPHPLNVIISLDGTDIPFKHQIFHQDGVPVSIFTTPEGWEWIKENGDEQFYLLAHVEDLNDCDFKAIEAGIRSIGKVPVIATGGKGKTDIPLYMALLKKLGLNHILIESPTFMWLLMKEKLMDEIFITHTTTFIGGSLSPGYSLPFTFEEHPQSEIVQLNRHGNSFIFTRQKLSYGK